MNGSGHFPSLDQLDIKLIEELEIDLRQSNKELAAKLDVSKPTIADRVKRLIDGGVISTVCWADFRSLGYKFQIIFGICTQPGHEHDVAAKLSASKQIFVVHLCTGRFSVMAWAVFHTAKDLSDFLSNNLKPISGITHIEKTIMLQDVKGTPRLLTDDPNPGTPVFQEDVPDELDLKIIMELQKDARQTASEVARKLGVYQSTIFRRMKRLMDENIVRIGIYTRPHALGYDGLATIMLKCDPAKVIDVSKAVAAHRQVQYVGIYAGLYDIVCWAVFRNLNDLGNFSKIELGKISGLKEIETIVNYQMVKMLFPVPIE